MEANQLYYLRQEDPFGIIAPEEFESLGIDPEDIPVGTVPALRHPSHIPSRFGGNAYGFGLVEGYDRLNKKELEFLLSVDLNSEKEIEKNYKKLNEIYKKLGLLVRFSKKGKPYYLIPLHFISTSLTDIRIKVDEISKIVKEYTKDHIKERCNIGIFINPTDLVFQEISSIFLEHNFIPVSTIEKFKEVNEKLDLFVFIGDIYEIVRKQKEKMNEYANYIMIKIYKLLNEEGEFFAISKRYVPRKSRLIKIEFKSEEEEKNFALFTHIFKTEAKYNFNRRPIYVTEHDFYNYLSGIYVEPAILNKLLNGKDISQLSLDEINRLPYLGYKLPEILKKDQKKAWNNLFSRYFEDGKLYPITPEILKKEWEEKFKLYDYEPEYMLLYRGKKRKLTFKPEDIEKEILETKIYGTHPSIAPDYRNSFEYALKVIEVIEKIKKNSNHSNIPKVFMARLKTPIYYRERRYKAINAILDLIRKKNRLRRVATYLNPNYIEGPNTNLIGNLDILGLFGFKKDQLRELYLIFLGHGPLRRIVAGKINESYLKPVVDFANKLGEIKTSLNFLRYIRLMSFAEIEASSGRSIEREELEELFRLYDLMVRAVLSKDIDWQSIVYEGAESIEGLRKKVIKKILMMMGYHRFLKNWQDIKEKGEKELESFADYNPENLKDIYNMRILIDIMNQFENRYLKLDPLQITTFYRKTLRSDLHGTARIFGNMNSKNVFFLLWIAINVAPSETINFNPLLEDIPYEETKIFVEKIDKEASYINPDHLNPLELNNLINQLNKNGFTIVVGTGLYLKIDSLTNSLSMRYMDLESNIQMLEKFYSSFSKSPRIYRISTEGLKELEKRFSETELFYQANEEIKFSLKKKDLPLRHRKWIEQVIDIRKRLRRVFLKNLFQPDHFYTNFEALYNYAPSILNFLFPFFKSLQEIDLSWHIYMKFSIPRYILNTTKKLYALVKHKKEEFQDKEFLHRLAKKEFGLMATGIIGVSDDQIGSLIKMLDHIRTKREVLFNALIKAFFFQEIGRVPYLREKYKGKFNPADLGQASAVFIKEEKIKKLYFISNEEEEYLIFLVRHHSTLHHMIRGEFSFFAIREILEKKDHELFDAFFIFSFIMLSAIREDLLLEDLAGKLFRVKEICDRIMDGNFTLQEYMNKLFSKKGALYLELREYLEKGEARNGEAKNKDIIKTGRMIYALERIFRLRGIRYVEFSELAKILMDKPIPLIYRQKGFLSIGYSTFEKEMFEAYRIYKTFQAFPEHIRHYILEWLVDDKVRIFGYENATNYMNYENQIKILLLSLIASETFDLNKGPISINFLEICQVINKRYEAINDYLNKQSIDDIWKFRDDPYLLFTEKEGVFFKREEFPNVLTVIFKEKLNIQEEISAMKDIKKVEELRKYYNELLKKLESYPFYAEDYKEMVKDAFEERLKQLFEEIVLRAKRRMERIKDFSRLKMVLKEILEKAELDQVPAEIKNRIMDVYELRKDALKRKKMEEIDKRLENIKDLAELNKYWEEIKPYLKSNREYTGREFELLVAKKFDLKERELMGIYAI